MPSTVPSVTDSLQTWLSYLETLHKSAIDLGLDRIREVARKLDLKLPFIKITVGGTNGKGSTCAMLEAILLAAGYKVGVYTSPHLVRFNERIHVNGEEATDSAIVEQLHIIEQTRGDVSLSYFEYTTLAALMLFEQRRVDVAVLEVGLGGRLDAVNLVDTDCAVITSIDIDHQEYLGDTREKIGWEKAHIFRSGKPAICADPMPPASIIDYAREVGATLWVFGKDFNYSGDRQQWAYGGRSQRRNALAYPALRGANQLLNASAALAALEALHPALAVPAQAVRIGLSQVDLPGRLQILPGTPAIVLDVAHNPHAAAALGQNLDSMGRFQKTYAVVGMLGDKDIEGVIAKLASRVDAWYCATLPGPRGITGETLAQHVRNVLAKRAALAATPVAAVVTAASVATGAAAAEQSHDHQHDDVHDHDHDHDDNHGHDHRHDHRHDQDGAHDAGGGAQVHAHDDSRPGVRTIAPRPVASATITVSSFDNPVQAFTEAQKQAGGNDRILVFGSFSTVGPVLSQLGRAAV